MLYLVSHVRTLPSLPPVMNPESFSRMKIELSESVCAFNVFVNCVPAHTKSLPLIVPHSKVLLRYPQHIIEVKFSPFNPVAFFFFNFPG